MTSKQNIEKGGFFLLGATPARTVISINQINEVHNIQAQAW